MNTDSNGFFEMSGKKVTVAEVARSSPPNERELSAMFQLLGVLVGSGCPILTVIEDTARFVNNLWLFAMLTRINDKIRKGSTVSEGMKSAFEEIQEQNDEAPDVVNLMLPYIHLTDVGEETGDLDGIWLECAKILDPNPKKCMSDQFGWDEEFRFFIRMLASFQNAGLPILRSLKILEQHSTSKGLKVALGRVCEDIEAGAYSFRRDGKKKRLPRQPKPCWIGQNRGIIRRSRANLLYPQLLNDQRSVEGLYFTQKRRFPVSSELSKFKM